MHFQHGKGINLLVVLFLFPSFEVKKERKNNILTQTFNTMLYCCALVSSLLPFVDQVVSVIRVFRDFGPHRSGSGQVYSVIAF